MPNDSPAQARARKLRDDRDRCVEAAGKLRHRIAQGRYAGLPDTDGDDLLGFATVLDSAALALSELPPQVRRDVLHVVERILDDGRKLGKTPPLSAGDGH